MDILNNVIKDDKFHKGDRVYSSVMHQIENVLYYRDYPHYRYVLNDIPSTSFSAEQLIPATKTAKTYLVKKLLDKRKIKGVTHYLVWYKGYKKADSAWIPESDSIEDGLQNMIDNFNMEKSKKK